MATHQSTAPTVEQLGSTFPQRSVSGQSQFPGRMKPAFHERQKVAAKARRRESRLKPKPIQPSALHLHVNLQQLDDGVEAKTSLAREVVGSFRVNGFAGIRHDRGPQVGLVKHRQKNIGDPSRRLAGRRVGDQTRYVLPTWKGNVEST